jgi:hypothetical protein
VVHALFERLKLGSQLDHLLLSAGELILSSRELLYGILRCGQIACNCL